MEETLNLGSIFKKDNQNIRNNDNMKLQDSMTKGEKAYRLQSEIRNMKPGQTLQGTVVGRNGSTVQIALSQDVSINAKVDQSINLNLGQLMSFEIKANNSSLLSLSPLYTNTANVETIMRALNAAGLPDTADNMQMVATMMEEGMPIDKDSILHMSRQLMNFPEQNPTDIIQMARLELPITETSIEQFGQYKEANYQILGSAESIMDELPQAFTELLSEGKTQQAVDLYQSVLDIFTSGEEQQVVFKESAGEVILETENAQTAENAETAQTAEAAGNAETAGQTGNVQQPVLPEAVNSAEAQIQQPPAKDAGGENQTTGTVDTLTGEQWKALGDMMEDLGAEPDMAAQIRNGQMSSGEILNLVKGFVQQSSLSGKISHELESLLDSREFGTMLKSEIEKQWLIEPQKVADPKKVEELYERIRNQSERLHEALETAGKGDTPVAKSVQNLQNNVDFMNKMNQVFTYIQLPLKMSGNNAHGDLYIYTNKKHLAAKDGNVSALLHLDMENLGPLDVYVAMQNNKVSTNFTLQDESALDLIEENIGILDERLATRGYDLKAQFHMKEEQEEGSPEGIMQTILNQEKNISVLSRTSFDMRA
jgi:hypothetical protein